MPKSLILAGVFLFSVLSAAVSIWAMIGLIAKSLQALQLGLPLMRFLFWYSGADTPLEFGRVDRKTGFN